MAKREYIEANKRWLEEKAKETGVKCLTKGIMYKVIKQGETGGASPSPRSIVTVHYTGRTINGRKFDSSLDCPATDARGRQMGAVFAGRGGLWQAIASWHTRRVDPCF